MVELSDQTSVQASVLRLIDETNSNLSQEDRVRIKLRFRIGEAQQSNHLSGSVGGGYLAFSLDDNNSF